ncbi:MAG TPA: hypothetical protein PKD09_16290 [Aggregatilinea sp.]|uniref:hypothetical protein n=1 Tax=Aggregatilinea sp. TaxID=2806333 RepID=UPI002BFA308B|nr:hypothetical protein [Aggregatilinea sp.]HML23215.1 hypothetical protein [Aggregatilinea sp.]
MPTKSAQYREALRPLIDAAFTTADPGPLNAYLIEHSNLPGPRGNLELAYAFADEIATLCPARCAEVARLLDALTTRTLTDDPTSPLQMPQFCGTVALGEWGARCDAIDEAAARLFALAESPLWRLHEGVAMGFQHALAQNWPATLAAMRRAEDTASPLQWRALVAAVADPPLLKDADHAVDALALHDRALVAFHALPNDVRRREDVRTLRQALGYSVSVIVAATPDAGFEHMHAWAAWGDPDVNWLLRENLKKKRLSAWQNQVERLKASVL